MTVSNVLSSIGCSRVPEFSVTRTSATGDHLTASSLKMTMSTRSRRSYGKAETVNSLKVLPFFHLLVTIVAIYVFFAVGYC